MKICVLLLLLTHSIVGLSQKSKTPSRDIYKTVQELSLVDNITWRKIKNDFSFGSTMVNYAFQLDSNKTFKYTEFGDVVTITIDRGTWRIKKKNILVLKAKKQKYYFDVVKFGKFLFYIPPEQRLDFVTDFKKEINETADYKLSENGYTKDDYIVWHLRRKYYQATSIQ